MYASTSAHRASASIRRAPSRTSSSITDDAADRAAPEPSRSAESETTVSIGSYLPDQRCRAGLAWNLSSVTREGTPHPKPIHRFQALLRNAGRDGQSICRSLNNSCAQKSLAYPSLQSHLHEASTVWQQLAAHLATAARTGVHVGELVAETWLPARSPAQTCHSALTEAIADRLRAGGGPPRS